MTTLKFADRLKYVMAKRGFTSYASLSRKSGVPAYKISEYARDIDDDPKLSHLAMLSIVGLNLHPGQFLAPMYVGAVQEVLHRHNMEIGGEDIQVVIVGVKQMGVDDG
tara:strand:- start:28006 stop:28329 length:324 start_codon:yes stop_codon:yes gene_type:complete